MWFCIHVVWMGCWYVNTTCLRRSSPSIGVLGGIQETPQFQNAIGRPKEGFGPFVCGNRSLVLLQLTDQVIPVIASIYNLAAGIMSLCVSSFGMKLGRKGTILLGCLFICIGALLQASSYSVAQIIVGRIVTGSGIGCIASAVPTYMVCLSLTRRDCTDL